MANFALSRNERLYGQIESTYATIPNTSGTATLAGSNCCRVKKLALDPSVDLLIREDKTGSRSQTVGVAGRKKMKSWSAEMDLAANGAAGVIPDCDFLLQATFGQAATISAGVSATYSLSDAIKSMALWSFRQPSTVVQRCGAGALVDTAVFELGANIATAKFSGTGAWVVDSYNFSSLDTAGKCGLTAFPSEPGSPVTNGGIIAGFTGAVTIDSNVDDGFGSYYPNTSMGGERVVSVAFDAYDDDSTNTQDLIQKALSKAAVAVTLQVGTVTGSKWTFSLPNVQLAEPTFDDSKMRYMLKFGESRAFASSLTSLNEVSLVIS